MRNITLAFPDTKSLWAFAQTLQSEFIQINSTERRLICNCTEPEISKALLRYKAVIVEEIEQRNNTAN
jgi:hypothetical protein